ncbi:hypothetical protein [Agrobacterium rosae]|uniref:Uncharacterized protein n=1 Tax=Agrobacterium rosae TaxID=1972867 RepID=A0A1R3TJI3_9HYPH|nr:hypothetical protein [Agrobacterium rosae]SCX19403.1 hypothetical protein DSM25559_1840 [Agrobacterium rosae]
MMMSVFRRTIAACAVLPLLQTAIFAAEGAEKTTETHVLHYTSAEGSRLIAISRLQALQQPKARSFRPVGLARYGYRPMEDLTVGFPVTGAAQQQMAGLTCFTCRMPEPAVSATRSPIEKDPKSLNFQGLLVDVKTQFASLGKGAF